MLDRAIIDHASPTLARLKLGNLFNYLITDGFCSEFIALREELREKGVTLSILRIVQGKALIYVYRADTLVETLRDNSVQQFLKSCGYHRLLIVHYTAVFCGRVSCHLLEDVGKMGR